MSAVTMACTASHPVDSGPESLNLTLIFKFDAWLSIQAEGRCL